MKHNRIRYDVCKIDTHRASYSGYLKCKKHLETKQQKSYFS